MDPDLLLVIKKGMKFMQFIYVDYELDVRKIREIRNVDSKIFCRRCGSGKVRRQSR